MSRAGAVIKRALSLALCLALFCAAGPAAHAAETDGDAGLIDAAELEALVEQFISDHSLKAADFSLGYCYTATGDTWYYNADTWFYPASMYKVPLMMLLSEKVKSGELSQDSLIQGEQLSTIESYILTYSNNDWAHVIRAYMGGDEAWHEQAKQYSSLADGDYDERFMKYCYFSNRYMTDVLKTLYAEPERFPNILECLLAAEPEHYFRSTLEGSYDIAQKYGSYEDGEGSRFNHASGVIYTPNPIILTVMTLNVGNYEQVIGDAAKMLTDYTLGLDAKLESYRQAKAEAEKKAEEEARAAEEKRAEEERELKARQEAERLENERAEAERLEKEQKQAQLKTLLIVAGVAVVALLALAAVLSRRRRAGRRRRSAAHARH